jgi:hypothetical protein
MNVNNAIVIHFDKESYVSDLSKVNCKAINNENIIPEDMTQERVGTFIEML